MQKTMLVYGCQMLLELRSNGEMHFITYAV
jgi:hypothetical protein